MGYKTKVLNNHSAYSSYTLMITEDLGVALKHTLGQITGIREVTVLSLEEYETQTEPKQWLPENADGCVVKLHLHGHPEKHIIKHISDVCFHTRTQVHYTEDTETASTAYICPTKTNFTPQYDLLGSPQPERLT